MAKLKSGTRIYGDATVDNKLQVTSGPVFIGAATSTGTASQPLQVTGGAYVSGSTGIGTTNPTSELQVVGNVSISATITAAQLDLTSPGINNDAVLFISGSATNSTRNGLLGIGSLGFTDKYILANFATDVNDYAQIIMQNKNNGTGASSDFIVNNNQSSGTTIYGDFGINATAFTGGGPFGDPDGTYLYASGGTLAIGTLDVKEFRITTGSASQTPVTRLTILGTSGDVGIGTTIPTANLHIGAATGSGAGNAPFKINSGGTANLLATPEVGAIEYDGEFLYQTPNATSGRAAIPPIYTFKRTSNGAAIGAAIADFFTTPSSLSLEASSVYKITCFAYFTKTTAGTATWTHVFSSAPTVFFANLAYSPVTGIANGTQTFVLSYSGGQATASMAHAATASLTSAVNHFAKFDIIVTTNAATNWRLRLTSSAGTATPLAGSFYTIEEVSTSTGTFVA